MYITWKALLSLRTHVPDKFYHISSRSHFLPRYFLFAWARASARKWRVFHLFMGSSLARTWRGSSPSKQLEIIFLEGDVFFELSRVAFEIWDNSYSR